MALPASPAAAWTALIYTSVLRRREQRSTTGLLLVVPCGPTSTTLRRFARSDALHAFLGGPTVATMGRAVPAAALLRCVDWIQWTVVSQPGWAASR
jgi:hypothetical protein